MAPSRGVSLPKIDKHTDHDTHAIDQQSRSALASAKRNLSYLISPNSTDATARPARFRTRALLRTIRYISTFIIWRLVRWAKYIAVGSLVAAVSATALGSAVTGVAWVAAPTGIGASIVAASVWGVGKFAARRVQARWKRGGGDVGVEIREQEEDGLRRRTAVDGVDVGPGAVPW